MNKIIENLKTFAYCSGMRVLIVNEAVDKNRKIIPFHKRTDKRLSDYHLASGRLWVTLLILLL